MQQSEQSIFEIHNYPLYLTPFVGRETELAAVTRQLTDPDHRLVTLVGPGGIGKTRLGLHVAAGLLHHFPDGIWLVELAALSDSALLPQAIASALGLRDPPDRPLMESLKAYLEPRSLLLVLDNCEHLRDACTVVVTALLAACPLLRIMATSREPLHIAGEVTWLVPPLSLPDPEHLPPVESLANYESIQLFVDRAQRAFPAFTLTPHNAPAVAQVCCRLDGLPLAIELAAARVKMLSVAQIVERLDDRFRLLSDGSPAAPTRQQTLKASLDWSYDLLSLSEQMLLRRLAIFAGGFDLAAAEAVCSGDGLERAEILDLLSQLSDKSLLLVERHEGQGRRYRLLETVRQYALDWLRAAGEAALAGDRHLEWYLMLAEQVEPPAPWGAVEAALLNRVEAEQDNWRAALQWSIDHGQAESSLRLAAALGWFWSLRAYLHEGRRWLAQALATGKRVLPSVRAKALNRAGALAVLQGDYEYGTALHKRALALVREQKGSPITALGLQDLGLVALYSGDYECAEQFFEDSLALFWEAHDQAGVASQLLHQGLAAYYQGNDRRAAMLLETSLALLQELGDAVAIARALHGLGMIARRQGDLNQSRGLLKAALQAAWEKGARLEIARCLEGLAGLACAGNQPERATRLFGAAAALGQAIGTTLPRDIADSCDRDMTAARAQLDEKAFDATWAAGRALTLEQAVAYALEAGDRVSSAETAACVRPLTSLQAAKWQYGGLTARERQVAALVAEGKSNSAIAADLVTTVRTVEAHMTHILNKLGFSSRTQVAAWAVVKGLASPPQTWKEKAHG
jgi:predicted ATPase/DNA-binding CsgD family transcriptional regulator